ncbi:hypothetical protein [Streptomyces sp. NPDC060194]|uniref:hypothetical protein n=1 Tax=Streptomyces sp. NPDC060194 TaxID=3347069 RepID=UPI003649D19A
MRRAAVCAAVLAAGALGWALWPPDPTPYEVYAAPAVRVDVRPASTAYADEAETAEELAPLVEAYVQRLARGDAADLAELGDPRYRGQEAEARKWIAAYGEPAAGGITAEVSSDVPYLAGIHLTFPDGTSQQVSAFRTDGVWGLAMGEAVGEGY